MLIIIITLLLFKFFNNPFFVVSNMDNIKDMKLNDMIYFFNLNLYGFLF